MAQDMWSFIKPGETEPEAIIAPSLVASVQAAADHFGIGIVAGLLGKRYDLAQAALEALGYRFVRVRVVEDTLSAALEQEMTEALTEEIISRAKAKRKGTPPGKEA